MHLRSLLVALLALGSVACDDRLRLALTLQTAHLSPAQRATVSRLEIDADATAQQHRYSQTVELGTQALAETERMIIELPLGTGEVTLIVRALVVANVLAVGMANVTPKAGALVDVSVVLGDDTGAGDGGVPFDASGNGSNLGGFVVAGTIETGARSPRAAVGDLGSVGADTVALGDGVSSTVYVLAHTSSLPYLAAAAPKPVALRPEVLAIGNVFGSANQLVIAGASAGSVNLYVYDSTVTTVVGPSVFPVAGLLTSATVGTLAKASGAPLHIIGVTSNGLTGTTMLLTASGTSSLLAGVAIPSANAQALALTQLDGSLGDVLIAEDGMLGFCQNKDPQTTGCAPNVATTAPLSSVSVIDFTGDGRLDVVAGNADAMHFFASTPMAPDLGSTPAVLTEVAPSYPLGGAISPVVADFNGDGNVDVAYIDSSASSVRVAYLGKNQLELAHDTLVLGPLLSILLVANLNSDGKPDLVAVGSDGAVWSLVHAP